MTATRLFTLIAIVIISAAVFLSVTFSAELSPVATDEDVEMFEKLQELYSVINDNYYEKPEARDFFSGAINGLLKELDPHSGFIDAETYPDIEEQYRGNYEGIGVTFAMIDDKITIMNVSEGGPSDAVGILMGDRIVEIEGESSVGYTNDQVQEKLRGPRGTKVNVKLERHGSEDLLEKTITRGEIPIKSVQNEMMLDKKTGYVQVTRFADPTTLELETALLKLKDSGMEQLILDLRNNGGGKLRTAITLTNRFLDENRLIVYTDGRMTDSYQEVRSFKTNTKWDLPIIVLVNHTSASASEIVSGALQDWDRALIVGETTFGKGLVQTGFILTDTSRLWLTTSHYFTPTGRLIQRPYKGLDVETYQMAGIDGNDSGEFDFDAEIREDQPVFMTASGRTVYGGGGVTPDILKKEELRFDRFVYSLNAQLIFFMYSREWVRENPNTYMDFQAYVEQFSPSDKMLQGLLDKAREREFVFYPRRGQKFSDAEMEKQFWELKEDIRLFLKAEIAQFYFGQEKGYAIRLLTRDNVLKEAREHFDLAAELANKQKEIKPDTFSANSMKEGDFNERR